MLVPLVVLLTVVLVATGIALLLVGPSSRPLLLELHRGSFIAWFTVMVVDVLAHLGDTAVSHSRDWYWRTRSQITGAVPRQWTVAASLGLGIMLGLLLVPKVGAYLHAR